VVVFIGLIMLAGIVVKNAIVLIDRVNQLREEGVDKINAIIQAAESRLRPISMTTLCTLLGSCRWRVACGDGNEVRAPMAITVDRRPAGFDAADAGRDPGRVRVRSTGAATRPIASAASASTRRSIDAGHARSRGGMSMRDSLQSRTVFALRDDPASVLPAQGRGVIVARARQRYFIEAGGQS
jgi:hypothetical protein